MSELIGYLKDGFKSAAENFTKDLEATPHESLDKTWGEGSRTSYDYVYEVAVINRRVAFRLREEDPGPPPWDFASGEWLKAPDEFRSKEAIGLLFNTAAEDIMKAAGEDPERKVKVGEEMQTVYQLLFFATMHTVYHDAQLNFIQEMSGDMAVHW